jgi:hypothetical protein
VEGWVSGGFSQWSFVWMQALTHSPRWHHKDCLQAWDWWAPNVEVNSRELFIPEHEGGDEMRRYRMHGRK